jgi:hypothetical protein
MVPVIWICNWSVLSCIDWFMSAVQSMLSLIRPWFQHVSRKPLLEMPRTEWWRKSERCWPLTLTQFWCLHPHSRQSGSQDNTALLFVFLCLLYRPRLPFVSRMLLNKRRMLQYVYFVSSATVFLGN